MATGILRFSPDLFNAWLLKQLRRVPLPLARSNLKETTLEQAASKQTVLQADQEMIILAKAAREIEAGYEGVINSLNTIHGRSLSCGNIGFVEEIHNLALALEAGDHESVRSSSGKVFIVLGTLQSNIPAWDYIRSIQQLVERCQALPKSS